nr:LCP family protein [uncultured Merdimonas sp.]
MARRTRYRRGRRRKRGFASWSLGKKIAVILSSTLLAVLAIGTVILASKMSKIETTKLDAEKLNISDEVEHETGYVNVALFGLDSRDNNLGEGNRSDTIMIASLNRETKEVKLVSVYRDTLLELDDGSFNKANAAYSFGGPEAAISMLNRNLDMNIEKYVTVNFNALVDVIDALDGLDLHLTEEEVVHMNNYCVETSKVTGKDYERIEPEVEGDYHLNGVQAVSYARIRYTAGGDFTRAERQRTVLQLIGEKAQSMSISTINKIIDQVFPQISTNFTLAEMVSYASDLTDYKVGETKGFPEDNTTDTLNEVGSVVIPNSLSQSVQDLHQFLFGSDGYTVSSTVQEIESGINARAADRATGDSYVEEEETYDYSGGTGSGTTDWTGGGMTDWSGTGTGGSTGTGSGTGTGGGTDWTGGGTGTGGGTDTGTGSGTGIGGGTDTGTGGGTDTGIGDGTAPTG